MPRKKIYSGKTVFEVVTRGARRRVTALKVAIPAYALGYRAGNAKFLGWLEFLAEQFRAREKEFEGKSPEERWKLAVSIIKDAKNKWREMDEDKKYEYITRAMDNIHTYIDTLKKYIGTEKELEKLIEEASKVIEEVAEVVS